MDSPAEQKIQTAHHPHIPDRKTYSEQMRLNIRVETKATEPFPQPAVFGIVQFSFQELES
jgi:hypothetical protein